MFAFSFATYIQRTAITVAGERMMPELGLSQAQFGWIVDAFLISYTVFQLPGGVLGEIFGARRSLFWIGLLALAATAATAVLPWAFAGAALFVGLLACRFIFGVAQAPIYPLCSGVIEAWFPQGRWNTPLGLLSCGLNLGSAVATPLVALLMVHFGWKTALVVTALPVGLVSVVWWIYGRDRAAEHRSVSKAELAELAAQAAESGQRQSLNLAQLGRLMMSREILVLTVSYLVMNYVYYFLATWCFFYLVQERHMSVPESGWLDALPFLAAAIGAWLGGDLADRICAKVGVLWGYRLIPLVALPLGGLALYAAVTSISSYAAVGGLCLAFFAIETTEGPYWAACTQVAQDNAMAATAILNTGGNLGGVIGIPITAWLTTGGHWTAAFVVGSACAVTSGLLWLIVDARRAVTPRHAGIV